VTGFPPGVVSAPATIHIADGVTTLAQTDLTTAYNSAAGLPCSADLTGQDLRGLTLTPGVYCFSSSAQLTGTLTLDGQGDPEADFVFKTGSTLVTASASNVLLINQAQACRVFHQVGSSATLGTGSRFVGTIMALTSITATTGALVEGRLLARNGAVTLDSNAVARPVCLPAATTTTSTTVAAPATTRATPATVTTRTTLATVTAATIPRRNSPAATTTKPPALKTSTRLATTGGQFVVLVAAALLAIVAGAMILCGPGLRAARPGSKA
jgi:type VI secretion system secreted protein VgrG